MFKQVIPVFTPEVRLLCIRPYPGHPKGCPNFGRRWTCPARAPLLDKVLDLSAPVYAIWTTFDIAAHMARMKALHPAWSERQLACCLYWQPRARKNLTTAINAFNKIMLGPLRPILKVLSCPEACGVNVTATMASIGEKLEWPPRKIAYQVALAGRSRRMEE